MVSALRCFVALMETLLNVVMHPVYIHRYVPVVKGLLCKGCCHRRSADRGCGWGAAGWLLMLQW